MSQHPQPTVIIQQAPSNGLGTAGFVFSLLGLLTCGLLGPIGLLLSFIGLFRKPNGLAIAGFIIGLIASAWVLILVFVVGIAGVAAAVGAEGFEASFEMGVISAHVDEYQRANGHYPSALTNLSLDLETLDDPWGRTYRYAPTIDGLSYTLSSDGPDSAQGTADDVIYKD
ncbi:MAG: hypothetical protein DHS20C14_21860 [Phycisphaeraceae bacterium]|nr:MAG: hypothetical protein DHS20C14_21860 [Phycisphaeraceae bacterium]